MFEYCAFTVKEAANAELLPRMLMEGRLSAKPPFPGLVELGKHDWRLVAILPFGRFHRLVLIREVWEEADLGEDAAEEIAADAEDIAAEKDKVAAELAATGDDKPEPDRITLTPKVKDPLTPLLKDPADI